MALESFLLLVVQGFKTLMCLSINLIFAVVKRISESEVAQSCPTLNDLMDYSLPGWSVREAPLKEKMEPKYKMQLVV